MKKLFIAGLMITTLMAGVGCVKQDTLFARTVGEPANQEMLKEGSRMKAWARPDNIRKGIVKLEADQMLINQEFEKGEYRYHLKVTFVTVNEEGIIEDIKINKYNKRNGKFQILASVPYYPEKFLYYVYELR